MESRRVFFVAQFSAHHDLFVEERYRLIAVEPLMDGKPCNATLKEAWWIFFFRVGKGWCWNDTYGGPPKTSYHWGETTPITVGLSSPQWNPFILKAIYGGYIFHSIFGTIGSGPRPPIVGFESFF